MNTPHTPELNSKDIRTVAYIMIVGVILVALGMLMFLRDCNAQEKPQWKTTHSEKRKPTGITLYGCKSVTVYISINGRIAAPVWTDKDMAIPMANPATCDYKERLTFYVLPSQDYEIQVTKPEAR
jgi:hypothetical protein